jgi:hypothetical protein
MMFKNEVDLLPVWVGYHGNIFGFKNLTIIDNGSDEAEIIPIIDRIEKFGVNVIRKFKNKEDFINKGDIILDLLNNQDKSNRPRFLIPLDCDEFIGAMDNGKFYFDRKKIYSLLEKYNDDPRVLRIAAGYDNHPLLPGYFKPSPGQKKCFFSNGTAAYLDHGFHAAQTRNGEEAIRTPLIYMHYHFKPYNILLDHSKQKLRPFIDGLDNIDADKLPDNVPGFHLLSHLRLKDSEEYYSIFDYKSYVRIPQFGLALDRLGYRLPFSSSDFGPEGFDPNAYLRNNADVAAAGVDPIDHYIKFGRNERRVLYR